WNWNDGWKGGWGGSRWGVGVDSGMAVLRADQLDEAAALLRGGGVVGMPTETVYGLAADAMNASAVARVFELKGRPRFDPLIVHAATPEDAFALATHVPDEA